MLLRTKELLDAADIGKLRPRWDGPFTVTGCPSPNAYTLALPRRMRCGPTVTVDRLKPFHARINSPPGPGVGRDPGGRARGCSTTRRRGASDATSCGGTDTHPRMMGGCRRSSWYTARRKWPSTTPQHRAGGPPDWVARALTRWPFLRLWPPRRPLRWPRCGGGCFSVGRPVARLRTHGSESVGKALPGLALLLALVGRPSR